MGAILAVAAGFFLLWEIWSARNRILRTAERWDVALGLLLFFCTVALLVFEARLPPDTYHYWSPGWFTGVDFGRAVLTVSEIGNTYIPLLPKSYADTDGYTTMLFLLSGMELLYVSMAVIRKPGVLRLYLLGTSGLLAFFYVKYGAVWHTGYLYIFLIACLWIAQQIHPVELKSHTLNDAAALAEKYAGLFIILALSAHLVHGAASHVRDWKYTHSAAKETAQFIKTSGMEKMVMIGDRDYAVSPIAGYLNNKIYYPRGSRFGSYVLWNKSRAEKDIDPEAMIREAERLVTSNRASVLVILNYKLKAAQLDTLRPGGWLTMVGEFTDSSVEDERYYLYVLGYKER